MKKSITLAATCLFLAACSSKNVGYKLSEADVRSVLLKQNNVEQCLYPQLSGLDYSTAQRQVYQRWSKAERYTLSCYTLKNIKETIGEAKFRRFMADNDAINAFQKMRAKMNHQNAFVSPQQCNALRAEYGSKIASANIALSQGGRITCQP